MARRAERSRQQRHGRTLVKETKQAKRLKGVRRRKQARRREGFACQVIMWKMRLVKKRTES
jgi:hypothetical protein